MEYDDETTDDQKEDIEFVPLISEQEFYKAVLDAGYEKPSLHQYHNIVRQTFCSVSAILTLSLNI